VVTKSQMLSSQFSMMLTYFPLCCSRASSSPLRDAHGGQVFQLCHALHLFHRRLEGDLSEGARNRGEYSMISCSWELSGGRVHRGSQETAEEESTEVMLARILFVFRKEFWQVFRDKRMRAVIS